ncbi:hypothetical protein B0H16DRAFT_1473398 [Mycena metata]|uniref:Restriction of telomere capping protein 4 C-terminal domain-containing protein n=1 Tax=Mycena metata TaxID=1033252 RepID=A0AAD7MLB6_9AGAR|nr:hypothetical protein B0H16DRAFT_1473398 [Mycena metata]
MTRKATAKHSNMEKMHEMNEELRKQKQTIEKLKSQIARTQTLQRSKHLIPRPKGQAGRTSGYSLQMEMGLEDDTPQYNQLYRMVKDQVHEYLPVSKTISQQEKLRLEHAIVQIGKVAPYFEQFEGHWPAHDMIAGYLLNMKGRRERDAKLEKLAESGGAVDNSEQEYEDESEVEDNTSRNKKLKPNSNLQNLKKMTRWKERPKPQKPDQDNLFDSADESPPNKHHRANLKSLPHPHLPQTLIPSVSTLRLVRYKVGPQGKGVAHLELTIRAAIMQEKTIGPLTQRGVDNQWPTEPDLSALPARICKFSTKIYQMIEDPAILQDSAVWRNFRLNIGGGIFGFAKATSKADFTHAILGKRCSYLMTTMNHQTLLHLEDFIFYILTPFAANLLISEDLKIDVGEADDVRTNSNDYGEALQPEEQEIDEERPLSPKPSKTLKTETAKQRPRFLEEVEEVPEKSSKRPQPIFKSGSAKPSVKPNKTKDGGEKRPFSLANFDEPPPRPKKKTKSDQPKLKSAPPKSQAKYAIFGFSTNKGVQRIFHGFSVASNVLKLIPFTATAATPIPQMGNALRRNDTGHATWVCIQGIAVSRAPIRRCVNWVFGTSAGGWTLYSFASIQSYLPHPRHLPSSRRPNQTRYRIQQTDPSANICFFIGVIVLYAELTSLRPPLTAIPVFCRAFAFIGILLVLGSIADPVNPSPQCLKLDDPSASSTLLSAESFIVFNRSPLELTRVNRTQHNSKPKPGSVLVRLRFILPLVPQSPSIWPLQPRIFVAQLSIARFPFDFYNCDSQLAVNSMSSRASTFSMQPQSMVEGDGGAGTW